jgi:hypothetical protein
MDGNSGASGGSGQSSTRQAHLDFLRSVDLRG